MLTCLRQYWDDVPRRRQPSTEARCPPRFQKEALRQKANAGLNEVLMQHQHPLPIPDEIFAEHNGGTTFTQIDFPDAYLQVEVDDEAKEV
ncbi:hypothetical protein TELCIR_14297 [Teladorsagia circumcincta]|uniref:Uncharacterized protein n=1 Tax=Teladorsagia circumcincta TaxID=45464 RepID=A0A2G9U1R4_TELCI|nr:hypothetical protein TELCIR_14297 [Teladorsagia circumcincta]